MRLFEPRGKTIMDYEFVCEKEFLIIKLSGSAEVNDRLSVKQHLAPYLQGSNQKVIVDLKALDEPGAVYITGVLNTIKKEFHIKRSSHTGALQWC
jgi:Ni,Fe-hydrogenase maturation factor